MNDLSDAIVRALLRDYIYTCFGSQAEAGRIWGVSSAFVNLVLAGTKSPTLVMLDAVGVERITPYRIKQQTNANEPTHP